MLQCLFKFNITLVNLSSVVVFAETANLLPELLKVMRSLHNFELVARILLILF